jgi:hypothetical protein
VRGEEGAGKIFLQPVRNENRVSGEAIDIDLPFRENQDKRDGFSNEEVTTKRSWEEMQDQESYISDYEVGICETAIGTSAKPGFLKKWKSKSLPAKSQS